jgi:hypothetical protein
MHFHNQVFTAWSRVFPLYLQLSKMLNLRLCIIKKKLYRYIDIGNIQHSLERSAGTCSSFVKRQSA